MEISDWRKRIDELDRKLVELLNERSRCAAEIGRLKRRDGLPLYSPEREQEVLEQVERMNGGPLGNAQVRQLFERIVDEARSVEQAAYDEKPPGRGV